MLRVGDLNERSTYTPRGVQNVVAPAQEIDTYTRDIFLRGACSLALDAWSQVGQRFNLATPPHVVVWDGPSFNAAVQGDWLQRDYAKIAEGAWTALPTWRARAWGMLTGSKPAKPTMDAPIVIYSVTEKCIIVRADRRDGLGRDAFFLPMLHAIAHQMFPEYFKPVKKYVQDVCDGLGNTATSPLFCRPAMSHEPNSIVRPSTDVTQDKCVALKNEAKLAQRHAWSRLGWLEAVCLVLQCPDKLPCSFGASAFERCVHEDLVQAAHLAVNGGDIKMTLEHPELVDALSYAYTKMPLHVPYGQRECVVGEICGIACKVFPDTFVMPGFEVEESTIENPADPKTEPLHAARQLLAAGPSRRGLSIVSQHVDKNPDSVEGLLLWANTVRKHMAYPDAVREMYEKVLQLDPDNYEAREGLTRLNQTQAQQRGAR